MADPTTYGPYGNNQVALPEFPEMPAAPVAQTRPEEGPRVPLTEASVKGALAGAQAREARALEPETSFIEGMGASVQLWDATRMVERLARPNFDDDTPINQGEYLNGVSLNLNEEEREYFLEVGKGQKSAEYALGVIKDRRMAQSVVGRHPVAGMIAGFADPAWLLIPPALRLGRAAPALGRTVATGAAAGASGALTAYGEGPVTDQDIALSMLMNGAATAMVYRGGKLVPKDPQFPQAELEAAIAPVKPHYKLVDGQPVEVPRAAPPVSAPEQLVDQVEALLDQQQKKAGIAQWFAWNTHKTMSSYGPIGQKVASLFYDNNRDLSINSVEAVREPVLQGLRTFQFQYEQLLRNQMAAEGAGIGRMVNPLTSREAYAVQARIEREVQRELFRRDQLSRNGVPIADPNVPKHITEMADRLDTMHKRALAEMQAAGVEGAENLLERPGYLSRKWNSQAIDNVMDRLEARGLKRPEAEMRVKSLVSLSLRRANQKFDKELSDDVAGAIVDRALRRGYFEDSPFNAPSSVSTIAEIRDVLKGLPQDRVDRVIAAIKNESDEAGKAGLLKHRMDLDYRAVMQIGDERLSIMDLIDSKVTNIVDQYNQQVATSVAFARKGLTSRSKIEALRNELLQSIKDPKAREEAKNLFDNTVAHFRGEPAGGRVNESFRLMQQFNRMISLAWSGLWQTTEYANAAAKYGLLKTAKYAMQEMPGFRSLLSPDRKMASSLNNILAENSTQSLRMRPYLARYEDGYDMDIGSSLQLSAQTAGQMVPFANAMRYVHHHQARMVGNLIVDRLQVAAKGDLKAREMLRSYGIEAPVMDRLAAEINKHGLNVDAWKDSVWMQVRPAFTKMMDESVLRGRLGDMPAFAAFDPLGKFIFTYRTFVLTAHNKLLIGGLERNGLGAVGLLMLYQFPMAMAAVQAQNVIRGDKPLSTEELAAKSIGQMGGLGLFTEPFRIATGESNSIGAPGLIFADRTAKMFQGAAQGDLQKAGTAALTLFPVANTNPIFNGMVNRMKEE